ncbi:MAG: sigma-70 family RNA polymerase sigma factor [Calothrix sp. SM1_7_51]|nr:sigma-70 family RNA polymerase sigma factor [Calothrix sp. SM1_7_51]
MLVVPTNASNDGQFDGKSTNEVDNYLVQSCLQGDTRSFRLLYRRHSDKVRSILYQLCNNYYLDDLVQEVFLRAWKGLPKFQGTATFSTWLYRITLNVASDQRKAAAQQRKQLQTLTVKAARQQDAPDLMELHYQDLLQRALASLSFDHQTILVLHDLEGVPQKEIASILFIPVGTVKSRLFHARAAIRQFLQDQGVQI